MAVKSRKPAIKDPNEPSLEEILQDTGDPKHNSFYSVDQLALFRLIYTVSALGGMVSLWYDSTNKRICFSVRLWGSALSYNVAEPSQFSSVSEPIVEKLCKVLLSKKLPPPPPVPSLHLVPQPKK